MPLLTSPENTGHGDLGNISQTQALIAKSAENLAVLMDKEQSLLKKFLLIYVRFFTGKTKHHSNVHTLRFETAKWP